MGRQSYMGINFVYSCPGNMSTSGGPLFLGLSLDRMGMWLGSSYRLNPNYLRVYISAYWCLRLGPGTGQGYLNHGICLGFWLRWGRGIKGRKCALYWEGWGRGRIGAGHSGGSWESGVASQLFGLQCHRADLLRSFTSNWPSPHRSFWEILSLD